MTTIATNGKSMAADSLIESGYICQVSHPKLFTFADGIFGCAGDMAKAVYFKDWVRDGMDANKYPEEIKKDAHFLQLVPGGEVFSWGADPYRILMGPPAAIGSGSEYAMGAMLAGATPYEAVKIAAQLDPYTGGEIVEIGL